MSFESATVLMP